MTESAKSGKLAAIDEKSENISDAISKIRIAKDSQPC